MNWYNENDRYPAQWLRNLIGAGHIPPGMVEEGSISEIHPSELKGFEQCHFFAGIGGWPYALRLAGVPDDFPVWTGSCPCQPFSAAGKRRGHEDERHLWPAWFRLIRERRPPTIFGEQVASKSGLAWFDAVRADLESEGYAVAAADLCAAGVGAPHIRQRLYFVAHRETGRRREVDSLSRGSREGDGAEGRERSRNGSAPGIVAHAERGTAERRRLDMGASESRMQGTAPERQRLRTDAGTGCESRAVADSHGRQEHPAAARGLHAESAQRGFWSDLAWIACRDGKARPVEPGTFPLAHGIPARVGKLRAYGNAIVPQAAAEFVKAALCF